MRHEGALHLSCSDTVAGDIDDVVDAAHEPVVTIRVFSCTVTREVVTWEEREIGLFESLSVWIIPESSQHARPRSLDEERPSFVYFALRSVFSDHFWKNPWKCECG
jgi:hypothetical protein